MSEYSSGGFFDADNKLVFSAVAKTDRHKEFVRDMHEHIQNLKNKNCVQERIRDYEYPYGEQADIELVIN